MPFDATPLELFPFAVGSYPVALGLKTWDGTPRRTIAGAQGFAADGLTPDLRTDAQQFNNWLGVVQEWHQQGLDLRHVGNFGDGSDGVQVEVGDRTLTRVHYYEDWTIDSGWRVTTAGYPVFVRGVLTIDGAGSALEWNGNDGVDGTPGAAQTSTVLTGGLVGGTGVGAGGGVGGASGNTLATGAGGAGGAGAVAGGAGGVATLADADARSLATALRGSTIRAGVLTALTAGAGGGGGGGGAGVDGGGAGSGGGHLLVVARSIQLLNGATIESIGGAGADGQPNGTDAGGGGGGGQGGLIYVIYREHDVAGGAFSVAGGAAGAAGLGAPDGTIGNVGGVGQIISIPG